MSDYDKQVLGSAPLTAGVMARAVKELCGAYFLEGCEQRSKLEFAKKGLLGWELKDTNILLDIIPMPEPWIGQWGYRLKIAEVQLSGDVHVCEFYMPQSEIPLSKQRSVN